MAQTNNVTRFLDSRKVSYTAYDLPEEKLGAIETAAYLQIPASHVFKTIVVNNEKDKLVLCVVPGDREVNLKAVSAFLGEKKMHIPSQKEAERWTGLQAGGISPLALIHKGFQVIVDRSALELGEIHISGGQRGLNLRLKTEDLVRLTQAKVAAIATEG